MNYRYINILHVSYQIINMKIKGMQNMDCIKKKEDIKKGICRLTWRTFYIYCTTHFCKSQHKVMAIICKWFQFSSLTECIIGGTAVISAGPGVNVVRGWGERHVSEDYGQAVSYTVIGSACQGRSMAWNKRWQTNGKQAVTEHRNRLQVRTAYPSIKADLNPKIGIVFLLSPFTAI